MSAQWYYTNNGQQKGPVTDVELKQLAVSGNLIPTDQVWKDGMAAWTNAGNLKGLFNSIPNIPKIVPTIPSFSDQVLSSPELQTPKFASKTEPLVTPLAIINIVINFGGFLFGLFGLSIIIFNPSDTDSSAQFFIPIGFLVNGISVAGNVCVLLRKNYLFALIGVAASTTGGLWFALGLSYSGPGLATWLLNIAIGGSLTYILYQNYNQTGFVEEIPSIFSIKSSVGKTPLKAKTQVIEEVTDYSGEDDYAEFIKKRQLFTVLSFVQFFCCFISPKFATGDIQNGIIRIFLNPLLSILCLSGFVAQILEVIKLTKMTDNEFYHNFNVNKKLFDL